MNPDKTEIRPLVRSKRRLRKGRVAILLTVLFVFFGGIGYAIFGGGPEKSSWVRSIIPFGNEKINVLVLGVDARDDDVGRSDTAFMLTLDTAGKTATMMSLPRDARVKIEGKGWDKLNHAYALGGSRLSRSTVEGLLGISVDYTVVINVRGFVRMIDALGGVTIDVEKRMYYTDPYDDDGGLVIDLRAGQQRMNGKTAIQYVRYRDEEGDIGRIARQQKFLQAVLKECVKPQTIAKLPELIREFTGAVKTDMPAREMVKLIPLLNDAAKAGLRTENVTGQPLWIDGISYWMLDVKDLRLKVARIEGVEADRQYLLAADRLAAEYQSSLPRGARLTEAEPATPTADKKTTDSGKNATTNTVKVPDKGKVVEPGKLGEVGKPGANVPRNEPLSPATTPKPADPKVTTDKRDGGEPAGVVKKTNLPETTNRL